jgi:hypothetical protein
LKPFPTFGEKIPTFGDKVPDCMVQFREVACTILKNTLQKQGAKVKTPLQKHGQPVYFENPSIVAPGEIAKRRPVAADQKRGVLVDGDTGSIIGPGAAVMYEFEEVDKERFVKLYLAGLKQAVGMSRPGMALFEHIYNQLRDKKEQDTVALASATSGMSSSAFSRGLRELVDREFIFRSPNPGLFWVNIRYMFNGDRLAFVKGYKVKSPSAAAPDPKQRELPL